MSLMVDPGVNVAAKQFRESYFKNNVFEIIISFHPLEKKVLSIVTVMTTMINVITDYLIAIISLLLLLGFSLSSWFFTRSLDPKLKEKPTGRCVCVCVSRTISDFCCEIKG